MENKDLTPVEEKTAGEDKPIVVNRGGRPPGAKNKDTLFKEMMSGKFQTVAQKDIAKVYDVLFDRAHKGDMKAIKLILDRVVPVTKAVDLDDLERGGLQINISVGNMEKDPAVVDAEYVEIID